MSPKISICIPTYNRAKYLEELLTSIVSQSEEGVEIVISDNASTDNTEDVVASYAKRFSQLIYFRHQENVGADLNYLKAAELATGEYIWLFGSDDIMKPKALSNILSKIDGGCDLYLGGLTLCTIDMIPLLDHKILNIHQEMMFDLRSVMERQRYFELALTTTAFFSFLGSIIVNRKRWNEITSGYDEFIGSLWVHAAKCLGIMNNGMKLHYLNKSLLNKRGDNDSFLDSGMAKRIGVSVLGYQKLCTRFFSINGFEANNINRVLRNEWPLSAFVKYRRALSKNDPDQIAILDKVFDRCYSDSTLKCRLARMVYGNPFLEKLMALISLGQVLKWRIHRYIYAKSSK